MGGRNFVLAYVFEGVIFFNTLFCKLFFCECGITCIITVVGAGGGKNFPTVLWRGGGGRAFFLPINFVDLRPLPPPPNPALNNDVFLEKVQMVPSCSRRCLSMGIPMGSK